MLRVTSLDNTFDTPSLATQCQGIRAAELEAFRSGFGIEPGARSVWYELIAPARKECRSGR